jgi:hypothetical protein
MDIGIGLPSTIPGTRGEQIIEWAVAAEERGFSTLGVIDRLVYGNTEPPVGPRARRDAEAFLTDHYAIEGETAARMAASALTDVTMIRDTIAAYERAGCDELLLFPCSPDLRQVELLAEAVFSSG